MIVEDDIFADFEVSPLPDWRLSTAFRGSSTSAVFQDRLGRAALRLHRGAKRLDRKPDRLEDRHHLRRRATGRRSRVDGIDRQRLPQTHGEGTATTGRSHDEDHCTAQGHRHPALAGSPAGMFLWCRLPEGINAATIARSCLQEGVVLAPGNAFSQSLSAGDFLRFNVAQTTDDRIFSVLARALAA